MTARAAASRPAGTSPQADADGRHHRPHAPADASSGVAAAAGAGLLVSSADESLLDVVDNLLNSGVVLHGDIVLGLADIDLIYLRLSLLLCAADRVLGPPAQRER